VTEPRLTPATRALLRAAKADAPSAAARAKVWSNLGTVGGAAGAGAAATAAGAGGSLAPAGVATSTAVATKMLALGTLLGGTITVGLAAALLRIGPAPTDVPPPSSAPLAAYAPAAYAPPPPTAAVSAPVVASAPSPVAVSVSAPPAAGAHHVPGPPAHIVPTSDDTLAREAAFVAEARGALVRGDPQGALRSIHAARQLPSHQLGPEELAVEAQVFRALGREDEAREADSTLKKQFPESALAR
jgi:hypothetical protein